MYFKAVNQAQKTYYRSIFLSDLHMGAKSFDAAALLDFLNKSHCEHLYLAGDIIDGWKLNKRWYWTKDCTRLIDALIQKQKDGTKVTYLPGNHDDEIRRYMPMARNEIARRLGFRIKEKTIHIMQDGRRFLILHGDQYDRKILRGPISKWSDSLYDWAVEKLNLNKTPPTIRINGKTKPFSLAKSLSKHGQWALYLLNNFETLAHQDAQKHHADGIICGHSHIPVIKNIKSITFANAGSWLKHGHTALVETTTGNLELVDWPASYESPLLFSQKLLDTPNNIKISNPKPEFRPQTKIIIKMIQDIWPEKTQSQIQYENTALPALHIHGRDHVVLKTQNIIPGHNIIIQKRPINLATKIFLKPHTMASP